MKKLFSTLKYAFMGVSALMMVGCGGETAQSTLSSTTLYGVPIEATPIGYDAYRLSPLTDADFNALSETDRYKVAVKLYATLFYGADFDELNRSIHSGNFISHVHEMFDRPNSEAEIAEVEEKLYDYIDYGDTGTVSLMLARLYHLQPGHAYINRWAAYVLTQTILFSPAYELDTVYTVDTIDVYGNLVRDFDAGFSMQWVAFTHMMTDENWRRFRSPEDNGREMLEIFLMDFNDAHVPLAGKALKNWKLDRRSNTLVMTLDENSEPITNLFPGKTIRNGVEFYSTLVMQPNFLPSVSRRLVDKYFPNFTASQKEEVVNRIVASRPATWPGLLKEIVYSKAYLLDSTKTKSFEEAFFQTAKALGWHPHYHSFYVAARNMDNMHQSTMRYKLGRKVEVPLDSQSFAWFHKTIRENVMINYERNASIHSYDDGWPLQKIFADLPERLIDEAEFDENGNRSDLWYRNERARASYIIQRLFVPIAGREANDEEVKFLTDLIDNEKYDRETFDNYRWLDLYGNRNPEDDLKERGYFAQMVLDYISRLDTVYRFDAVK
ncbi:hypothetical protein [Hydrogenimonas cancrithermarum]|uniref:Lipoprotein n=1 Tax=Hydrogenimonas cancrithermarum TaxID=2993563 RepID=A0ABM8FHG7_9BACT|nr:hypothetical protein [Hydrogenimonas cancrithermarum]BDY11715.1 hypothetical protein HCR_00270 [Hydrogenimonas cancrithermarum]